MQIAIRLLIALVPFALTLVFAWLVAGPLSLGGGEKDILLVIPLLLWSLAFLCSCLVLWRRQTNMPRSIALSTAVATATVGLAWVVLLVALHAASAP